jgi:peptide/nickel transport system permease protein
MPIVVQLSLMVADTVLAIAGLGFLGLGAQPPTPEWGVMLGESRLYLWQAPHLAIFPGLAVCSLALTFNLLGDSLRKTMDVRAGG